jgi:hypothetical protein
MSDKEYLRKLVKAIVFILAFAVSGVASIGLIGLFMGVATGVGGFLISGAATSVTAASGGVAKLIPKLFAPSAKAKAGEVGPGAGTWAKLQQAYMMEKGGVGTCEEISYKLPGDSRTRNFEYECGINRNGVAYWAATSRENLDECPRGSSWILFMYNGDSEPVVRLPENKNCQKLTPNFSKLGISEQDKEAQYQSKREEEENARKADEAAKAAADLIMKELMALEKPDTELAMEELAEYLKKWLKEGGEGTHNGTFFTFEADCGEDTCSWTATSKKKIGDCPAKSKISMGGNQEYGKWNDVPKKCRAITPKEVTSYTGGGQ